MKYKKMITIMGALCLCSGQLINASNVFAAIKTLQEDQSNASSSTDTKAPPKLPPLPSSEVTENTTSSAFQNSSEQEISTETPSPSKSETTSEQQSNSTESQAVSKTSREEIEQTSVEPRMIRIGDWGATSRERGITDYYGTSTDLVVPAFPYGYGTYLQIDFSNITFHSIKKEDVRSIRFELPTVPTTTNPTICIQGNLQGYSNLLSFQGDSKGNTYLSPQSAPGFFKNCQSLREVVDLNIDSDRESSNPMTSMAEMFAGCTSLTRVETANWDVSKVKNMSRMFYGCENLNNINTDSWQTSSLEDMSYMFNMCEKLEQIGVANWDVSNVINMTNAFSFCRSIKAIATTNWKTGHVEDMSYLFNACNNLTSLPVFFWDVSNVKNMSLMFNATALSNIGVDNWDVSNVTNMRQMFGFNANLRKIQLENWNVESVTHMNSMFTNSGIQSLDLSKWNTKSLSVMNAMFSNTQNLTTLKFGPNFNTSKISDMSYLFNLTPNLKELDLSNFSWTSVVNTTNLFKEKTITEKKILAQPGSPLETYDFKGNNIVPLTAVSLDAGQGRFSDGTQTKNVIYTSVVNPSIDQLEPFDNPTREGYTFIGWNKDTTLTPQRWIAQYRAKRVTLPNIDQIGDGNTVNNGLENSSLGIAYQPKYLTGSGKILGIDGSNIGGRKTEGMLYLAATDEQGKNPAVISHIGVKAMTNSTTWTLQASFTSNMPTAQLFFEDPIVTENKDGNLKATESVYLNGIGSNIASGVASNGHRYKTTATSAPITLMKPTNKFQPGVYDFSARVGMFVRDNAQVATGSYEGNVHWNLANVPV